LSPAPFPPSPFVAFCMFPPPSCDVSSLRPGSSLGASGGLLHQVPYRFFPDAFKADRIWEPQSTGVGDVPRDTPVKCLGPPGATCFDCCFLYFCSIPPTGPFAPPVGKSLRQKSVRRDHPISFLGVFFAWGPGASVP